MNLEILHCLGTTKNSTSWPSYERIGYNPIVCVNNKHETRMKIKRLRKLWRKIKREKRRIFCSKDVVNVQYDPSSYLKNFDDGYLTDADNFSQSFSARFAAPSMVF
ncbi:hypothetical protein Lalb_Chr04g0262701 [Lupinus albus]|uniref:Uncharacterized protein n=1 Tax=Lupinus albus TaxID=3870 RepID=A0A6A4QRT0_LUPAL|nr:hypothetical protein Lalb_Chr04g0262701 [Lupinus albus]